MNTKPIRLAILIGSTREGRFADVISDWFVDRAALRPDFEIDLIDLAVLALPVPTPSASPPTVDDFVDRIDRAEAFVVVTPEYNHSFPASLKHAIDLAYAEWNRKPVAFVSYGGISGGLRAVEQLRQVFAELKAMTIRDSVSFHGAWNLFDDGRLVESTGSEAAATTMLDDLAWWALALRRAKQADAAVDAAADAEAALAGADSASVSASVS